MSAVGQVLNVLRVLVLLKLWLILLLYITYKMSERPFMFRALPAAVEVQGVEWIAGDSGLREGCGVAVFRLAPGMQQRLQARGLAALDGARQARGHSEAYYHYQPWQATPVLNNLGSDGWLALSCGDLPQALEQRINNALEQPGSYFARKDEGVLLVLPAAGLVVYGYNG